MKKAFVFTMEALISLLLAISMIAAMHSLQFSTFSDVYLNRLADDFQQIAAKKYYLQTVSFANGDPISKKLLENEYLNIISQLGNYCLKVEAKNNAMEINCKSKNSGFKNKFATSRLWFDGNGFFEVKMMLIA